MCELHAEFGIAPLQVIGRNLWSDGSVEIKGNSGPSSGVLVEALPRALGVQS